MQHRRPDRDSRSRPSPRCRRTAPASSTCCAPWTPSRTATSTSSGRAGRRRYAAAPHPGTADTAPAWSPDGTRLAFLRDGQRARCSPPTAASPSRSPTCRSAPARRCGARTATRIAFSAPVDPDADGDSGPLDRRGPARLPGRRRRHVRRDPQPAARLDLATGDVPPGHRRRRHAGAAGLVARRPHARVHPQVGADSDLTFRTAVHLLDVDDPQGDARASSRSRTASPPRSRSPPTARACWSSADPGDPVGHAAPAAGPARRRRRRSTSPATSTAT